MRLSFRSVVVLTAVVLVAFWAQRAAAQFPGGFIVKSYNAPNRPRLTQSQIQSFVPSGRGKFTFPAPYNTIGVRITIPTDCGGADCVDYVGYSYWKNMNNHQNSDTMYIVLGLNRNRGGTEGPTLFSYNKVTDAVTKVGPLFDPSTKWSWASANGWYFSVTMPTKMYVNYWGDPTFFRYDVVAHTFQQVFDISSRTDIFGSNRNVTQMHSSDDDKVHSFTVQDSSFNMLGCGVYHEDTKTFQYFPAVGTYDECNLDLSGRWLLIHEGSADLDNHVIDLQTNTETVILNQNGRLGHLDMGENYAVGNSGSVPLPQAALLYKFPLATTTYPIGPYEFYNANWSTSYVNHISHQNRKAGVAPEQQYACGSNLDTNPYENEIACFKLDSSFDTLVVAPVMSDMNAPGGGDSYSKYPKGNIDITGQYFIWTSNLYGNRLDAFITKIPSQVLTGIVPPPSTQTLSISSVSAPLVASSSATITWSTNLTSDSQVDYGLTTSYGTSTSVNSSMVTSHSQAVSGLAANTQYHYRVKSKDSVGDLATSTDFTFTTPVASDTTPPVISGVSVSSITSSSATVSWTTDEASDSQVEYGTTTSYGASSALNSSMVTSHSQSLTGLGAGMQYHYRVKSKDTAGNLATSQDFTFTTAASPSGDTTPPAVSITSPTSGAHVKGKIKIVATASDNVGVTSVQFQVDGNNLGSPDTLSPYTIVWNTSGVAQGYHTLTAIARDKAGNATTSAPVTVIIGTVTADATPPTVSISSPLGGTVSATVTVSANAGDNVGVAGVQFKLDGVNLGSEDTAAPYTMSWDTTKSANGSHVLTAVARDAAGNTATSAGVTVNVSNLTAPTVQNVVWTNLVNVTATGNSIQKTGGCSWCDDAGPISSQQIGSGNGYVEFTASETTTNRAIGLSHGNTDTTRTDIDYAIMMWTAQTSGTWAEIYENDVYKSGIAYATGDVFRVAVEGGVINYYKNGVVWYTSFIPPVYPLLVDTSLWSGGATITNAKILGTP
jgi:hypothetical protein